MATLLVDKYEARKAGVLIAPERGHILVARVFGEANEVSESYKSNKHMHAKRAAHTAWRLTPGFAHRPLLRGASQRLKGACRGMVAPKWHAKCLGLVSMTKQSLMPKANLQLLKIDLFGNPEAVSVPNSIRFVLSKNKNAGGNPPALDCLP